MNCIKNDLQLQMSFQLITKISRAHIGYLLLEFLAKKASRLFMVFSLFFFTLPVFSQQLIKKEKVYTLKKGRHHADKLLKNRLLRNVETLHWYNRFDTSARYIIRNPDGTIHEDQHDWSKLSGITFTPWQPQRNTAMAGWRYNNVTDSIELTPYFHVNGRRIFQDDPHLTIAVNEPFEHEVHLNYKTKEITVTIRTPRSEMSETHRFTTFRKWLVQIHPYFGGNKRAPRSITLRVRRETIKINKHKRN